MAVQAQIHDKFRVFIGTSMSDLSAQVASFTGGGSIAAKSLAIEFVESRSLFVLSIGYAPDQAGYAVSLSDSILGDLPSEGGADELSAALESAADAAGDVLCHSLYVDSETKVHLVVMLKS